MKTHELTNVQLDWAVAQCEAVAVIYHDDGITRCIMKSDGRNGYEGRYQPSTDWAQGGPIIEREKIEVFHERNEWGALINGNFEFNCCVTPLFAAMSCYVASKLGYDIWIPEALER